MATRRASRLTRANFGFVLAKASQRWNELLQQRFAAAGRPEIRASYGSILVPLFEQDGLRMSELARRARLSKQTMTTLVRRLEREQLVERRPDPIDGRAALVVLTARGRSLEPVAGAILAELEQLAQAHLSTKTTRQLKQALLELTTLEQDAWVLERRHLTDAPSP